MDETNKTVSEKIFPVNCTIKEREMCVNVVVFLGEQDREMILRMRSSQVEHNADAGGGRQIGQNSGVMVF